MGYGCDVSPSAGSPPPAGEALVVGTSADRSSLVGPTQLTLYVFDNDSPGVSACNSGCAASWPPLSLAPGQQLSAPSDIAASFSTLTREDGSTQVAYNGRPLYYYSSDASPGDIRGDGVGGVWHLAAP
jgi:predicted lipoprotein with Yx(FWY)xxD motif